MGKITMRSKSPFFKLLFAVLILLMHEFTCSKVLILIPTCNNPDFIELQYKTFKKFLKDEHEIIIFNDARDSLINQKISDTCNQYKIQCINIPQEIHDLPYLTRPSSPWYVSDHHAPSVRNCNVVQYMLNTIGFNFDGIVALIEGDVFLIDNFSIEEYMKDISISGYLKQSLPKKIYEYLWVGIIFLDMRTMPDKKTFNINCGSINKEVIDSGGYSYFYMQKYPNVSTHFFDRFDTNTIFCNTCKQTKSYRCTRNTNKLKSLGFKNNVINFIQSVPIDWGSGVKTAIDKRNIEFYVNKKFVHFFGGSGYAQCSYLKDQNKVNLFYFDKSQAFHNFITNLINKRTRKC